MFYKEILKHLKINHFKRLKISLIIYHLILCDGLLEGVKYIVISLISNLILHHYFNM